MFREDATLPSREQGGGAIQSTTVGPRPDTAFLLTELTAHSPAAQHSLGNFESQNNKTLRMNSSGEDK